MRIVKMLIEGDLDTGEIKIAGPTTDMRVVHWLLGEARRCCEREATKREVAAGNGKPPLIVAADIRTPFSG